MKFEAGRWEVKVTAEDDLRYPGPTLWLETWMPGGHHGVTEAAWSPGTGWEAAKLGGRHRKKMAAADVLAFMAPEGEDGLQEELEDIVRDPARTLALLEVMEG